MAFVNDAKWSGCQLQNEKERHSSPMSCNCTDPLGKTKHSLSVKRAIALRNQKDNSAHLLVCMNKLLLISTDTHLFTLTRLAFAPSLDPPIPT